MINYVLVQNSVKNIHVFVGEDDYLVEEEARKVIEATVDPASRATAVEIISGEAGDEVSQLASIQSCIGSLQTPPFLEPIKVTWWRGVTFLPHGTKKGGGDSNSDGSNSDGENNASAEEGESKDKGENKDKGKNKGKDISAKVKETLEKFVARLNAKPLPSNQVFIITAPKLLRNSIVAKGLYACAEHKEFVREKYERGRQEAASFLLIDFAKREDLIMSDQVRTAFIAKVGCDTRMIVSELAKLRTYLGKSRNTVKLEDIATITSVGFDEPELWDVTDALAERDLVKLLEAIKRLEGIKSFGIVLASITIKFFRDGVLYREALDKKWITSYGTWDKNLSPEILAEVNLAGIGPEKDKMGFLTRKGAKSVRNYSLDELRLARYRLMQVRERLVSVDVDDDLIVQELLRIVVGKSGGV